MRCDLFLISIFLWSKKVYYESVSEAARLLNTGRDQIQQCIKGNNRYSTVKGYLIREIDENGNII